MMVSDLMTREVEACRPGQSLAEAAGLMWRRDCGAVPVVDEGGAVVGIITDRDICMALASRRAYAFEVAVGEVMSRDVVTCTPEDDAEEALEVMRRRQVRRLPVVDAHGRLLGMITETDVLHAFAEVLAAGGASSRLEVSLPDRPGELARVLHVLGEELRLNVTSLMVMPRPEGGRKTAVVHVGTIDPREAIEALEAAGAVVGWPSLEHDLRKEGV